MKKLLFPLAALAIALTLGSCKNETKTETATENETTSETQAPDANTEATVPQEQPKSLADINGEVGAAFLDSLKANDKDVKFTDSGLGYKVIKAGKGDKPTMNNVVKVKYTGKHIDGSVFDSSGDQVIEFPLNGVIRGFSEGLVNMNRGSVYELYIPAELGYGMRGAPGAIGPNETLIFELELVDF